MFHGPDDCDEPRPPNSVEDFLGLIVLATFLATVFWGAVFSLPGLRPH